MTKIIPPEVQKTYEWIYDTQIKILKGGAEQIDPAFIMVKHGHAAVFALPQMENERDKDMAAFVMRRLTDKTQPDITFYVSEAWVSHCQPGDIVDGLPKVAPRNDPHHLDALTIIAQWKGGTAQMVTPILHAPDKTRSIAEEPPALDSLECTGRFVVPIEETA